MDTSECSTMYLAKDRLVNLFNSTCHVHMIGYWVGTGILLTMRMFVVMIQIRGYLSRRQAGKLRRSVPLSLLCDSAFMILTFPLFIGPGAFPEQFSVATTGAGAGVLFLSLFFFYGGLMFNFLKMVHLGQKVLPKLVHAAEFSQHEEIHNISEISSDYIMLGCWVVCYFSQLTSLCCAITLLSQGLNSIEEKGIVIQIGLFSIGITVLFLLSAGLRHNIRLRHYMDETSGQKSKRIGNESESDHKQRVKKVAVLCRKMKIRDYVWGVGIFLAPTPCILASFKIIPMYVEFIFALMLFNTVGTFLTVIVSSRKTEKEQSSTAKDDASRRIQVQSMKIGPSELSAYTIPGTQIPSSSVP